MTDRKPGTLGRLKHLWECKVARTDNGDVHDVNIDAYWDPAHKLTEESVSLAAKIRARLNAELPFSAAGLFVVTEVKLVA